MIKNKRFFSSLIITLLSTYGCSNFSYSSKFSSQYIFDVQGNSSHFLTRKIDILQNQQQFYSASSLTKQAKPVPFRPSCQEEDKLCAVWSEFRTPYPYPTQRIAGKINSNDELVLIISEPPNSLSKRQWRDLIKSIFSTDLVEYRTFKWSIGSDGWVEDIVLRIKQGNQSKEEVLDQSLTRDRIALLKIAMFGSSIGTSSIEKIKSAQSYKSIYRIPNLKLTASEVFNWFTNQNIKWGKLFKPSSMASHWLDRASVNTRQVMISDDQTLILLTFPLSDIITARRTGIIPEQLSKSFREFAVSSDIIIGGAWSTDQIAILARARQVPTQDYPPLRVETFQTFSYTKDY